MAKLRPVSLQHETAIELHSRIGLLPTAHGFGALYATLGSEIRAASDVGQSIPEVTVLAKPTKADKKSAKKDKRLVRKAAPVTTQEATGATEAVTDVVADTEDDRKAKRRAYMREHRAKQKETQSLV